MITLKGTLEFQGDAEPPFGITMFIDLDAPAPWVDIHTERTIGFPPSTSWLGVDVARIGSSITFATVGFPGRWDRLYWKVEPVQDDLTAQVSVSASFGQTQLSLTLAE